MDHFYSASELTGLPMMPKSESKVRLKAKREGWKKRKRNDRGGGWEYAFSSLPAGTQAALLKREHIDTGEPAEQDFTYNRDELWRHAERCTQRKRDIGAQRADLLRQVMRLVDHGKSFQNAAAAVAIANEVSVATLRNWYYGVNNRAGARNYNIEDWPAALIPGHTGRQRQVECDPRAWDWIVGHYLTQRQPTFSESYRRLVEVAAEQNWQIPSERTLQRRIIEDIPVATRVYLREGAVALNRLHPPMRRDKSCFNAGEAVSGDGLKFDKVWVDWGDEIINTTTAWVWQDIRSNKILAHRVAKTENTDLFRLATYDLTAITLPNYVQVDNTRVAANKAMTGMSPGRHRFKNKTDDPVGILLQLGMDVHFTNPNQEISNPGVKPVERSFGIGGIHDLVATHPAIIERGFSRATAIPVDEFREIVASEIKRFNARKKRRTDICRGVLSFDDAFNESYAKSTVRKPTEGQRRLLLLMPEKARANRTSGVITLKAGASKLGRHQYWCEALAEYKGMELVAYYDPEKLDKPVAVYTLDGRYIADADHKPTHAFNDTAIAREHAKGKQRIMKSQKLIAVEETRLSAIERAAMYPEQEDVITPAPGIVQGNFQQKRHVDDDHKLIDLSRFKQAVNADDGLDDDEEMEANLSASIYALRRQQEESI